MRTLLLACLYLFISCPPGQAQSYPPNKKLPRATEFNDSEWTFIIGGQYIGGMRDSVGDPETYRREFEGNVRTFHIGRKEVSIAQYRNFMDDIERELGADSARALAPDFSCVPDSVPFLREYLEMCWDSSAFQDYPVQCITWHQAVAYTEWLSENIWDRMVEQGDTVIISAYQLSLPTEDQLEFAMLNYYMRDEFHWRYPYQLTGKKKDRLKWLGNSGEMSSSSGLPLKNAEDDGYPFLAPTNSFLLEVPDVYNLFGNVAEFTSTRLDTLRQYHPVNDFPLPERMTRKFYGATFIEEADTGRIIVKGGSWMSGALELDPGSARAVPQNQAFPDIGFRPVLEIRQNICPKYLHEPTMKDFFH